MGIFAKALISGEEIKEYIPQREPVIMVDTFYGMAVVETWRAASLQENQSFSGLAVETRRAFSGLPVETRHATSLQEPQSYTGLTVNADNIFVEAGRLNEAGIIEHIAQSCAVRVGYLCKQQNIPIPVGYIGALKNMKIRALPQAGQQLFTTVTVLQEVFDITLVSVEVKANEDIIATGEMKIFLHKHQ